MVFGRCRRTACSQARPARARCRRPASASHAAAAWARRPRCATLPSVSGHVRSTQSGRAWAAELAQLRHRRAVDRAVERAAQLVDRRAQLGGVELVVVRLARAAVREGLAPEHVGAGVRAVVAHRLVRAVAARPPVEEEREARPVGAERHARAQVRHVGERPAEDGERRVRPVDVERGEPRGVGRARRGPNAWRARETRGEAVDGPGRGARRRRASANASRGLTSRRRRRAAGPVLPPPAAHVASDLGARSSSAARIAASDSASAPAARANAPPPPPAAGASGRRRGRRGDRREKRRAPLKRRRQRPRAEREVRRRLLVLRKRREGADALRARGPSARDPARTRTRTAGRRARAARAWPEHEQVDRRGEVRAARQILQFAAVSEDQQEACTSSHAALRVAAPARVVPAAPHHAPAARLRPAAWPRPARAAPLTLGAARRLRPRRGRARRRSASRPSWAS